MKTLTQSIAAAALIALIAGPASAGVTEFDVQRAQDEVNTKLLTEADTVAQDTFAQDFKSTEKFNIVDEVFHSRLSQQ